MNKLCHNFFGSDFSSWLSQYVCHKRTLIRIRLSLLPTLNRGFFLKKNVLRFVISMCYFYDFVSFLKMCKCHCHLVSVRVCFGIWTIISTFLLWFCFPFSFLPQSKHSLVCPTNEGRAAPNG